MGVAYQVVCNGRDRAEWLKARKEGIGGSDSASALGINPYSSRLDLYADKVGAYDDPDATEIDEPPSEYARWGHLLEPLIMQEFARMYPTREIRRDGRLLRSRTRLWQMTTLDGTQHRPEREDIGLIEIKTTMFDWDRIPQDLWCQVQHQFAVTGYEWGSFAVWNRTRCNFTAVDIEPDYTYIEELNKVEAAFWDDIQEGRVPDPAGSEACAKALAALYPEHEPGSVVELGAEWIETFEKLTKAKSAVKQWNQRKSELEQSIKAEMGDKETARLTDGSSFTLRSQTRKASQSKESTFRVLRMKES